MPVLSLSSTLPSSLPTFSPLKNPNNLKSPFLKPPSFIPKSVLLSVSTSTPPSATELRSKASPAENSRTIMELSSSGTFSTLTHDGWPIGIGAQFVVDAEGSPALCLKENGVDLTVNGRSSFHVQLEQNRSRTAQCTVIGSLKKSEDELQLKKLCAKWEKKFGEEIDSEVVYVISVEKVLQIEDFKEEGIWVKSSEYLNAQPDPLRNFAEKIVDEMNSQHVEDVRRLCKVYVDAEFEIYIIFKAKLKLLIVNHGPQSLNDHDPAILIKVTDTKIIWVDRLGFDLYMYSDKGVFAARIPFPREVTDEKGVKSSFNSMSHLAWEIEKSYVLPDFEKVKCLKKIR